MPRYRFHIRDDIHADDDEGRELPGLEAAREAALEGARDLVCDAIKRQGNVNLDHYIEIADDRGETLLKVTFREAFTVTGGRKDHKG
ncbi:hypothetical protein [Sphingosinicella sp. CPCC 101087]|uniref:DUF6894 family protein n=1 Tax=Sphingosinicella sp. CPCC 101087 TaxID=2497754 RepID=UPI00101D36E9|nr:hypothetical protein [Sphingosinicella sp. CPCC 101087]